MKIILKVIIVFSCFNLCVISQSSAQSKQDSIKHWSVGICFSPGFYVYRQFPDYHNNGLPIQDFGGYPLEKNNKGGSISKGINFTFNQSKKIVFQLGFLSTKETMKDIGININRSHGSTWGGRGIYNYTLTYFDSFIGFRYNFGIKKKINPFLSLALVSGFLYKEYIKEFIAENLTIPIIFSETNKTFRFNRIVPNLGFGFHFCSQKSISYSLSGNIDFSPIYQKRNTYEDTNGIKLSLNFGIHYNF
jgi:hypothetical protein